MFSKFQLKVQSKANTVADSMKKERPFKFRVANQLIVRWNSGTELTLLVLIHFTRQVKNSVLFYAFVLNQKQKRFSKNFDLQKTFVFQVS